MDKEDVVPSEGLIRRIDSQEAPEEWTADTGVGTVFSGDRGREGTAA